MARLFRNIENAKVNEKVVYHRSKCQYADVAAMQPSIMAIIEQQLKICVSLTIQCSKGSTRVAFKIYADSYNQFNSMEINRYLLPISEGVGILIVAVCKFVCGWHSEMCV